MNPDSPERTVESATGELGPVGLPLLHDSDIPAPRIPDYEVLKKIGCGSYGDVWLVRSTLGTYRAAKVVYRRSFEHGQPFEREFKGIQRFEPISLTHESQVKILHVGRSDAAGYFYYVMELADDASVGQASTLPVQRASLPAEQNAKLEAPPLAGRMPALLFNRETYTPRTLKLELQRRARLPVDECIQIGLSLTTALAHLHERGLIHRDIKPSNIIFAHGVPKLADIGLVTDVEATRSFVGTEGFIAPEGPGTVQADLYSLGKVLYEISMGRSRLDFPALPANWDDRPEDEQARLLEFNEILVKACESDVRKRYQSAQQMDDDLALLQRGRSVRRQRVVERRFTLCRNTTAGTAGLALIVSAAWLLLARFNDSTIQRFNAVAKPTAAEVTSIFVLPFRDDGTNQVDELLLSRMTDGILDGLEKIDGVKVGPRKSGWVNRDEDAVRSELGKQFGSRYALSGRVNANSNELAVTVALHDAAAARALWSEAFTSVPGEQIELERRIIKRTAQNLGLKVSPEAVARITQTLQNNLKALELFQQAPGIGTNTRDDFSRKVEFLTQATTSDLRFAQAHAALALANAHASEWHRRPKETMPAARREAQAAVDLDDTLADAHLMLGVVARAFDWDWRVAELEYTRGVELAPTSAWNHWAYASYLRAVGRLDQARVESETAARLSPGLSPSIMAEQLYAEGRFPEALASALKHLETDEDRGQYFYFGELYLAAGHIEKSIGAFEKTRKLFEGPDYLSRQGYAYARLGQREKAIEVLRMIERDREANVIYVSPYFIAVLHAGLGNTDECFTWLNRAIEDRCVSLVGAGLTSLASDPCWDELRHDPRFTKLLDRIGLPQAAKNLALRRGLAH